MRANSAFFCATLRPSESVIWIAANPSLRLMPQIARVVDQRVAVVFAEDVEAVVARHVDGLDHGLLDGVANGAAGGGRGIAPERDADEGHGNLLGFSMA